MNIVKLITMYVICATTLFCSCNNHNVKLKQDFSKSKAEFYRLAQYINVDDTGKLKELILNHTEMLDAVEKSSGSSLLFYAIHTNHFPSAMALCNMGADVNLYAGDAVNPNAVMAAADKHDRSDFLQLVLQHGGSPNNVFKCKDSSEYEWAMSPLMTAAQKRLESVKLLVAAGANPEYRAEVDGETALSIACINNHLDIVKYLMEDIKVDFKKPVGKDIDGNPVFVVNLFRTAMIYELDSKEYELKMELVHYMKLHGVDYRKTKIPEYLYGYRESDYINKY